LDATIPIGFSADETTDVGNDTGSRVVPDYEDGSTFTGAHLPSRGTPTRRGSDAGRRHHGR
jgi:hypothetical protein